jgi:hypothetical protein
MFGQNKLTRVLFALIMVSILVYPSFIVASAQSPNITGWLQINSGDPLTTYYKVTVSVSCSGAPDYYCASIRVSFPNEDANLDPNEVDIIQDIDVQVTSSSGSDFLTVLAEETAPDTGEFAFELVKSVGEDYLLAPTYGTAALSPKSSIATDFSYPLRFEDGDVITITKLPLSRQDGEKYVLAYLQNNVEDSTQVHDTIILDATPPPPVSLISPSDSLFFSDTTPSFDWSDVSDANGIGSYAIEIDDDLDFSSPTEYRVETSSFNLPAQLGDGQYFWRVWAVDSAGNAGQKSVPFSFNVDTVSPAPPIIISPLTGAQINDPTPLIAGRAEPNSFLNIFVDGFQNTINVPDNGVWEFSTGLLDSDLHTVYAVSSDRAGNVSPPSERVSFAIITLKPVGSIVINSGEQYTNSRDAVLDISCRPAAGAACAEMRVSTDGIFDTEKFEDFTAARQITLPTGDGAKQVYLQVRDSAGNLSDLSADEIILDTGPPAAPIITTPAANSEFTDPAIQIGGTAEPGSRVQVFGDARLLAESTADGTGSWVAQAAGLDLGQHSIVAAATDLAGNTSFQSDTVSVRIRLPAQPEITIDSVSNLEPRVELDSITVSGRASSIPDSRIVVDWDDGSIPTEAEVTGDTWTASHTYGADQQGSKNIIARLIVSGREEAASTPYPISLGRPMDLTGPIVASAAAVAAGLGGLKLYQSSRANKPSRKSRKPPASVKIVFNYGIESNDDEKSDEFKKNESASDADFKKIQDGFQTTLGNSISQVRDALNYAKQATDIVNFCREAKEEPDNFLSRISDTAFAEMLKAVGPFLGNFFIEEVNVGTELRILDTANKQALFDVDVQMRPIRPFIEAALLVNGVKSEAARFLFEINSLVQIRKLQLTATGDGLKRDLEDINVKLEVLLASVSVIHAGRPVSLTSGKHLLNKPIRLTKREFKLSSLSLRGADKSITSPVQPEPETTSSDIVEKVCPSCKMTVMTNRFCPECGYQIIG